MTTQIISILPIEYWLFIFGFSLFFGLFILILNMVMSFSGGEDFEAESDGSFEMEADTDTDLAIDGEVDVEVELEGETEVSISEDQIESDSNALADTVKTDSDEEATSMLGSISVFLFIFGIFGLLQMSNLSDFGLIFAIISGIAGSKLFDYLLRNIAKTNVNPISLVSVGDVGTVIYGLSNEKPGIVLVIRKDGFTQNIMAKGAFLHDIFDANEKGYIWAKEEDFYLITKGNIERLEEKKVKKALD
jgi:hypothetical protein